MSAAVSEHILRQAVSSPGRHAGAERRALSEVELRDLSEPELQVALPQFLFEDLLLESGDSTEAEEPTKLPRSPRSPQQRQHQHQQRPTATAAQQQQSVSHSKTRTAAATSNQNTPSSTSSALSPTILSDADSDEERHSPAAPAREQQASPAEGAGEDSDDDYYSIESWDSRTEDLEDGEEETEQPESSPSSRADSPTSAPSPAPAASASRASPVPVASAESPAPLPAVIPAPAVAAAVNAERMPEVPVLLSLPVAAVPASEKVSQLPVPPLNLLPSITTTTTSSPTHSRRPSEWLDSYFLGSASTSVFSFATQDAGTKPTTPSLSLGAFGFEPTSPLHSFLPAAASNSVPPTFAPARLAAPAPAPQPSAEPIRPMSSTFVPSYAAPALDAPEFVPSYASSIPEFVPSYATALTAAPAATVPTESRNLAAAAAPSFTPSSLAAKVAASSAVVSVPPTSKSAKAPYSSIYIPPVPVVSIKIENGVPRYRVNETVSGRVLLGAIDALPMEVRMCFKVWRRDRHAAIIAGNTARYTQIEQIMWNALTEIQRQQAEGTFNPHMFML